MNSGACRRFQTVWYNLSCFLMFTCPRFSRLLWGRLVGGWKSICHFPVYEVYFYLFLPRECQGLTKHCTSFQAGWVQGHTCTVPPASAPEIPHVLAHKLKISWWSDVLKQESTTHRVSSVFWRLINPLKEREGSEIGAPGTKQLHCLLKMMKRKYKRE